MHTCTNTYTYTKTLLIANKCTAYTYIKTLLTANRGIAYTYTKTLLIANNNKKGLNTISAISERKKSKTLLRKCFPNLADFFFLIK